MVYCAQTEVEPLGDARNGRHVGERRGIARGDARARRDLVGEDLQLLDQHRGLDGVEAAVQSDADAIVLAAALAVHAQAPQDLRELVVVGEDRAAVAVAAERLGGKEARAGRVGQRPDLAVAIGRAEGLRGVVDHEQLLRVGDRGDRGVVGGLAEQIDRDDRLRLEPELARHRDRAGEALRIEIEAPLLHVHQHRRRADQRRDLGGGVEREGRHEHRVAGADALRHQRHQQRIGAAGAGDRVTGAAERREIGFDRVHLGAQDELAMAEHARDRIVDRAAKPPALGGNVNERDWTGVHADLLIHMECTTLDARSTGQPARAALGATRLAADFSAGTGWRFRGPRRLPRR